MINLEAARARRWWRAKRRIAARARAAAFIDDVGFALLFPKNGIALPSLWEVVRDERWSPSDEWGPDLARLWQWKDELPTKGLAWYGRFLRGQPSFLSIDLLRSLYPRAGTPEDFRDGGLSPDARRIVEVILLTGPTSAAALRRVTGLEGKRGGTRFSRAVSELGRALVVTHYGVEDTGSGWPSAVLELTARAFPVASRTEHAERRRRAGRRFLKTMIATTPADVARAFGGAAAQWLATFEELVRRGEAVQKDGLYYTKA